MNTCIRVMIVDDHPVVRHGLRSMLELKPEIEVVGEAQNGLEAVQLAKKIKPDVILMDLVMPKKDGLEAIIEIRQSDPLARILVLTSFSSIDRIIDALKAGASGYLLKESTPAQLLKAIQEVYHGEMAISQEITRELLRAMVQPENPIKEPELTNREMEILMMAARGLTNFEIANELVISEGTVRFHFSNIFSKLQISNRTQAVLYALKAGWADLDTSNELSE